MCVCETCKISLFLQCMETQRREGIKSEFKSFCGLQSIESQTLGILAVFLSELLLLSLLFCSKKPALVFIYLFLPFSHPSVIYSFHLNPASTHAKMMQHQSKAFKGNKGYCLACVKWQELSICFDSSIVPDCMISLSHLSQHIKPLWLSITQQEAVHHHLRLCDIVCIVV